MDLANATEKLKIQALTFKKRTTSHCFNKEIKRMRKQVKNEERLLFHLLFSKDEAFAAFLLLASCVGILSVDLSHQVVENLT
jgi:hypothetical protein